MDTFYLSENVYIYDDKMYKDDKIISYKDWHKHLSEIGWQKLPVQWIKQLNRLSLEKSKNSRFGVIDCGTDGDCFFHCIAFALNSIQRYTIDPKVYNRTDIKQLLADSIDRDIYRNIISIYKILKDSDDLDETWDPYTITIDGFKDLIVNTRDVFWGDHILIQLVMKLLNINIIILNNNQYTKSYNVYNTMVDYDSQKNTIILLYDNKIHFRLIGYFWDNLMISLFDHRHLPDEIKKLINV